MATTRSRLCLNRRRSTGAWRAGGAFDLAVLETRPGFLLARVSGKGARRAFEQEPGGHRWQRIPPNEKRGRVHTSTVTVAVLPEPERGEVSIREGDIEWQATRGSGPGGQHRNKTDSAVQMRHVPSGIVVRCEGERSQHQNRAMALAVLSARLAEQQRESATRTRNGSRKEQVGSGMRGDKVRTVRCQDGIVTDHRSGAKIDLRAFSRGDLDGLRY